MKSAISGGPARVIRRIARARAQLRRRFAQTIEPRDGERRAGPAEPRVEVFIASLDTALATELTIRSLRNQDRSEYDLVVGDGGSTDGSVEMLKRFEDRGWLRAEYRSDRWGHHDWIEHRITSSPADYLVFCDSDVEFRKADAIRDLVATARRTGSALVAAELCAAGPGVEPVSGAPIVMAQRPSAWLFLVAPPAVRDLNTSFAFSFVRAGGSIEGGLAFDTGAAWFAELRDRQLPWAAMAGSFTRRYHHHAGLSWRPMLDREDNERARQIRAQIVKKLDALRVAQDA